MCRWIAYLGSPTFLSHYVTEPKHSLVSQSLHALEATASMNGDGFGLGWYGEQEEPGLFREVRPAWSDENLYHLCRHIRSHLFFAHVRAATASPITRPNCHPFAVGKWMFMHNGFISDWSRLRRRIEDLIPDEFYPERQGSTDSEAIFLSMMGADIERNPIDATATIIEKLRTMVEEGGPEDQFRFTAALTNGRTLYAFRYAVKDNANTLYYRTSSAGTVIASEPLDDDRSLWIAVPENRVLIAEFGKPLQVFPFLDKSGHGSKH